MLVYPDLPGLIGIAGSVPPTRPHAHHAVQLSVARRGTLEVDGRRATSALVDANVRHALTAEDALTVLVEPESHNAALLRDAHLRGAPVKLDLPLPGPAPEHPAELLERLLERPCARRHVDPRIEAVLAWFDEMQAAARWPQVTLAGALSRVHLSEGRFLHLFKAQTGVTWRRALIWRRAQVALQLAVDGATFTEAAHAAGYADSAHLSRQVAELFGLTPSAVLEVSQFLQGEAGPEP